MTGPAAAVTGHHAGYGYAMSPSTTPSAAKAATDRSLGAVLYGLVFAAYLLIPFYKGAWQQWVPVDLTVALALATTALILPWSMRPHEGAISGGGLVLWIALGLLVFAGTTWAPDQGTALSRAINYAVLVFMPILVGATVVGSSTVSVRSFLLAFYALGLLTVALGLLQVSSSTRLEVLNQNTIQTGRAALFVPVIGLGLFARDPRLLLRSTAWLMTPPAILVAIASGSRGPILMLLIIGGVAFLRYAIRPTGVRWNAVVVAVGIALATAFALTLAADELPKASTVRFEELGQFVETTLGGAGGSAADTSAGARVSLIGLALSLFGQHPVLGVGTSGFESLSPYLLGPNAAAAYPHNALAQFAVEFGVVGLILFAAFVILALSRALPATANMTTLRLLGLFFLLNSMVSGNIYEDRELFGSLLLLLLVRTPRRRDDPGLPSQWWDAGPPPNPTPQGSQVGWDTQASPRRG